MTLGSINKLDAERSKLDNDWKTKPPTTLITAVIVQKFHVINSQCLLQLQIPSNLAWVLNTQCLVVFLFPSTLQCDLPSTKEKSFTFYLSCFSMYCRYWNINSLIILISITHKLLIILLDVSKWACCSHFKCENIKLMAT